MTLAKVILSRLSEDERGITFIKEGGEEKVVTYKNLLMTSLRILGYLQSKGLRYGDEIVLLLKEKEDFINVFWAGILGGIIPVPISIDNIDAHKLKFFNIWKRLNNPYLICDIKQFDSLIKYAEDNMIDNTKLSSKSINIKEAYNYEILGTVYDTKPEDIAFIQFSSGSTGEPKGVMLKHSNLLANIDGIITNSNMGVSDSLITWMPLSHDMGLIGCHLMPVTLNIDQVHINTIDFIKRPTIWLEKASKHKSTILQSPNFGYRYTLLYLQQKVLKECDLSNVRLIFNGAEPISEKLCKDFLSYMSRFNLKKSSMYPVYGLAEACLAVTFPKPLEDIAIQIIDRRKMNVEDEVIYLNNENNNFAATFVDVGFPIKNTSVRITGLDRQALKENTIGFVEIKGDNVTSGYYNMEDKTKEVINEEGWLNTGDLGFMKNGRLIVVGRYKDVLFLNGQNFYAHDIERIIQEVAGIKLSEAEIAVGAAKNYDKQTEEVIAFVLYRKKLESFLDIESSIKRNVNSKLGIHISHVIPIKKVPKTTSGKVQRFELIKRFQDDEFRTILEELREIKKAKRKDEEVDQLEKNILSVCMEYLVEGEIGVSDNLFEAGIDSLKLNQIASRLQEYYGDRIKVTDFFANPTIRGIAKHIKCGHEIKIENVVSNDEDNNIVEFNEAIAIIGIAIKIADINDLDEYWECILNGKENVKEFPENRKKDLSLYFSKLGFDVENIKYHRGCYIDDIDVFDYKYFKTLPVEAIAMSPAQRLFLETATRAVEDAGYGGGQLKGTKTGVYVGYIGDINGYEYQQILKLSQDRNTPTGYLSSNIAGRVSYIMDLKGPTMIIDTACSSSMVALDLACNAIKNGNCDQAIVGGVRVKIIPIEDGFRAGFESSDSRTKPFDMDSDGMGDGEGVVSVLIKPLSRAINDKDNIYAVIKGSAVNHDGASIGLSAPNPVAQTNVILEALNKSKVNPRTISYLEANGTGTPLGDTIEIQALKNAYSIYTDQKQYCSIGSVKANIGSLFEASGLASVVKCCLMMKYKKIPPLVNFNKPNKEIDFSESPFYVKKEATDWVPIEGRRRCGISNFGFSGTNGHAILEEFIDDNMKPDETKKVSNIFTLSAKNKILLGKLVEKYIYFTEKNSELRIEDISYTANVGRDHHEYRLAIITNSVEDLLTKLKKFEFKTNISQCVFYGIHKKVKGLKTTKKIGELSVEDIEILSSKGNKLLTELNSTNRESQLLIIAQVYTRGANLIWSHLYENQTVRKMSMPTYEFEGLRCWPKITLP